MCVVYIHNTHVCCVSEKTTPNFHDFSCADLRIGVSAAKFDTESDFEIRLAMAPQKPGLKCKKIIC